jgi:hypothetical protein
MPTLRGRPGQPEFGMCSTRTLACSAASSSSRAGVASVEPSSTKIASYSSGGSDWSSSERMQSSMSRPGL